MLRHKPQKDNSQRQLKAANLIKEALVEVLRKGKGLDIRLLSTTITVSEVTVSIDLRVAHCYVLPFGLSSISAEELLDALEKSKHAIRNLVTKKINLRYSPELIFIYDNSFDKANKLNQIFKVNNAENNNENNS